MTDRESLVLVTGATGAVGLRVVQALCEAGHCVRCLSRDALVGAAWPAHVEARRGDITDLGAVRSAMQGVNAVFHLAAILHVENPPNMLQEVYERVNVKGTATVVEAARDAGVLRIVFFSTITVYGTGRGGVLAEGSATQAETVYARTKLAAEKIVLYACCADGDPMGTVLRLAAVYGSRMKGNYRRLLQALARGRFVPVGKGLNRRTLVYDRDVGQAAVLAAVHPAAAGRVYNVTNGQVHTMREIIAAMCEALGRKPPRFQLPVRPVRYAAGLCEDAARLLGLAPLVSRSTVEKFCEDMAVSGERFQAELGFTPRYELLTGFRETVQEMRLAGEL